MGPLGEVIEVTREESIWIVEFRMHTLSEEFVHRIEITAPVGNVITHDRNAAPA